MSSRDIFIEIIATPLGTSSLIALVIAVSLYINLSRRLGMVTKMAPRYRWFIVGGIFIGFALGISTLRGAAFLTGRPETESVTSAGFGLYFVHLPLLIGVTICLAAAWYYWSWLLTEKRR